MILVKNLSNPSSPSSPSNNNNNCRHFSCFNKALSFRKVIGGSSSNNNNNNSHPHKWNVVPSLSSNHFICFLKRLRTQTQVLTHTRQI